MTTMNVQDIVESFVGDLSTDGCEELKSNLRTFVVRHASHHRPIALVTSGGTVADLELNSVRCLDNFSTGLRGAISVEEFLKRGYAVIHLWRVGSGSPFGRLLNQSLDGQANHGVSCAGFGRLFSGLKEEDNEDQLVQSVLDNEKDPWLTDPIQQSSANDSAGAKASSKKSPSSSSSSSSANELSLHRRIVNSSKLQMAVKERNMTVQEGRLLTVPFRSVEEYIAKLKLCSESIRDSQALAIVYLAAAVSDYYIPKAERSTHKIQSDDGTLTLNLKPVPKVMNLLRTQWAPDAFLCSFKLETDKEILRTKAERAVKKYGCHMVIGNLLHSRHEKVSVLAPPTHLKNTGSGDGSGDSGTSTTPDVSLWPMRDIVKPASSASDTLEVLLLDYVVESHFEYISSSCNGSFDDKSGTQAAIAAHIELEAKRRQVERELFWKQVQTTSMEWAGVVAGAALSYMVSAALRNRMNS